MSQNEWLKQSLFLIILQVGNISAKVSADLMSVKGTPLGLHKGLFFFDSHIANTGVLSLHYQCKDTDPIRNELTLVTCQKSHS